MEPSYKYLYRVDSPADLKKLSVEELTVYCAELRSFIVKALSENPGHLGANLGVIELTVALHYVFDTPDDRIVWDVGHQAYAHKIITGRRDSFHANRTLDGLSGFPRREESPYDTFTGGHASNSISAALGMAEASRIRGEQREIVAVIGDGALTGGLAFEGMNNAGGSGNDLLVILNDNKISIDPNVGALKEYLLSITSSKRYNRFKLKTWNALSRTPRIRSLFQKAGNALKLGVLQQSNLFESLNFRYFGPADGHDLKLLINVLRDLKNIKGPKLLHLLTVKGKGYTPAETNQRVFHAPGRFNPDTGEILEQGEGTRFQDVFGHTLTELMELDEKIVGITPAMPSGCSLNIAMARFPQRCFDVGIAEGHAVTFAAGLACEGLVPFCNIYSSFAQRAYDNVIHDVALQNLPVVMCLDRAGLVGEDGPTHHGVFDIASLRPVPNLVIACPASEADLKAVMKLAARGRGPFVIRYPRGYAPQGEPGPMEIGKARVLTEGKGLALLTLGRMTPVGEAVTAKLGQEGIGILHADLRFAKPLDEELLYRIGKEFPEVVTLEDGAAKGGAGSAVAEFMQANGYPCRVTILGIGDNFVPHGKTSELFSLCGLDEAGVETTIRNRLKK